MASSLDFLEIQRITLALNQKKILKSVNYAKKSLVLYVLECPYKLYVQVIELSG